MVDPFCYFDLGLKLNFYHAILRKRMLTYETLNAIEHISKVEWCVNIK